MQKQSPVAAARPSFCLFSEFFKTKKEGKSVGEVLQLDRGYQRRGLLLSLELSVCL